MRSKYLILTFLFMVIFFLSCNHYDNEGDAVYYKSWNEAEGSSVHKLFGVNPNKFRILEYGTYAKDDRLVFYNGDSVKDADAQSFEALGDFYAKDKYRGYYGKDSIKTSRGLTFKIIDSYYSTDGRDIFFMQDPLKVTSIKNFRFVFDSGENQWERWATDGKYYYIKKFKVPSNDYKHIVLYKNSGGISKDSQWAYCDGRKLNYDDSGKRIIDTLDIISFKVKGYLDCRDKFGCINPFHGREKCDPRNN